MIKQIRKAVVIVAGGSGSRMGSEIPKQFIELDEKPILMHTIEAFRQYDPAMDIVLVLPKEQLDYWRELVETKAFDVNHSLAQGGETRFHSVRNGLNKIDKNSVDLIAIHDGVRPFVSYSTIDNAFRVAQNEGCAIPSMPLIESIRKVDELKNYAVDRTAFRLIQTPQVFRTNILLEAYKQDFDPLFTDDASVVEKAGFEINLTAGNSENIKITTPFDLLLSELIYRNFRKTD